MADERPLSPDQVSALARHYQQLANAITAANNGLILRLQASGTLAAPDRAVIEEWSRVLADIHTASAAHVMGLAAGPSPAGVQ